MAEWGSLSVGSFVTHRGGLFEITDIVMAFGEHYAVLRMLETGDIVTAPIRELVEL